MYKDIVDLPVESVYTFCISVLVYLYTKSYILYVPFYIEKKIPAIDASSPARTYLYNIINGLYIHLGLHIIIPKYT